jgi:peptidyl-prolyl cis-trans isomerase C
VKSLKWKRIGWAGVFASLLIACSRFAPTPTPIPTPTVTPLPPTATPEPLAARVNGQAILLGEYEREVERCQAGKSDPANCPALVLQNLIEQKVVEQAALTSGVVIAEAEVEAELQRITQQLGGLEAYQAWLTANRYTDDEFRQALRRDLLRARMADQVTANIGDQAEQVHARELLVADEATAQDLLTQIKGGQDFVELAVTHSIDLSSRIAGGDLGWFPRGLLTVPEVEQAAFTLQPGETSDVIHSALGYHIVQTLEHDPVHPLSPGARQALLNRTYQSWLERQLAEATIEKFIEPDSP